VCFIAGYRLNMPICTGFGENGFMVSILYAKMLNEPFTSLNNATFRRFFQGIGDGRVENCVISNEVMDLISPLVLNVLDRSGADLGIRLRGGGGEHLRELITAGSGGRASSGPRGRARSRGRAGGQDL